MDIHAAEFIKSAPSLADAPQLGPLPEIALVGRSNVGKSSLVNCLTARKSLAKTSNTPGKTRLINYYLINQAWFLVDLPGYGYARVSKTEQARWQRALEKYLRENPRLRLIYLLIDGRHGMQPNDVQMAQWLRHYDLPLQAALTKADKASQQDLRKHQAAAARLLGVSPEAIPMVSATDKRGRDTLLGQMAVAIAEPEPGSDAFQTPTQGQ